MVVGRRIDLVRVVKRKTTNLKDEYFPKPKRIRNKTANQPTNNLFHISRDQFYPSLLKIWFNNGNKVQQDSPLNGK